LRRYYLIAASENYRCKLWRNSYDVKTTLERLFEDAAKFSDKDECNLLNKFYGSMIDFQTLGVTTNE